MTTSFFRYFSLLLIVISIEGCFMFKDLEFKGIASHKIEEVSLKNGLRLNLGVQLQNPNWFAIKAKGGEINVKANGINLGKFQISRSVNIPKKSDGIIEIGIESKLKNLLGGGLLSLVSMAIFNKNDLNLSLLLGSIASAYSVSTIANKHIISRENILKTLKHLL